MMIPVELLSCPSCRSGLSAGKGILSCESCSLSIPCEEGIPLFLPVVPENEVRSHTAGKSLLRRLFRAIRPPHHSSYFSGLRPSYGEGRELKKFLAAHTRETVLNIGSLSGDLRALHPRIFNLDICRYASVDIVADAHELPFRDSCVDVILLKNVIEHVKDPLKVMAEIRRVLKPGGILYIKAPFLQPFHAVPNDFQRYTREGMRELLKEYEEVEFGIAVGPASMLSWILREFLAVLTSFGNKRIYETGLIVWGWLTFWVQYLDIFMRGNKLSHRLASAYYGFYRKVK